MNLDLPVWYPRMEDNSTVIQGWLIRLNEGEPQAREELLARTQQRLERMARKMLHGGFVRLSSDEETMDVVQDVNIRLLKSWDKLTKNEDGKTLGSAAEYFMRTARLLREVLIDLSRKHHGRGTRKPGTVPLQGGDSQDSMGGYQHDPGTETLGPSSLSMWTEFHHVVEQLPEEIRQVVDLHWYQDLTYEESAQLLGIGESTVRKRWVAARLELQKRFEKSPFDWKQLV
ncbi:MAG: sigma-70 family RNA polymerase sigma factor [Planctomycetia bacterium]|nr:sigma-70 family RNA polymerase sigma factor [Planctomycetia bacterium]